MAENKNHILQIEFLEEIMEEILSKNYNLNKIMQLGKQKGIIGLTYDKIRNILKEKGIIFDKLIKEWVKSSEFEDNSYSDTPDINQSTDENQTVVESTEVSKPSQNKDNLDIIVPTTSINSNDSPPEKSSIEIEDLFIKITNQEVLVQKLLRKVSVIEEQIKDKIEESLSKNSSGSSISVLKFVELSYSNGRRYEVTLREDLVNKATEKLKHKYSLESIDITKLSHLFEIILFDYINSP